MDSIQQEIKRHEDFVKFRGFQVSELVGNFLKALGKEVLTKEIQKQRQSE